jgi:hypothetical protein
MIELKKQTSLSQKRTIPNRIGWVLLPFAIFILSACGTVKVDVRDLFEESTASDSDLPLILKSENRLLAPEGGVLNIPFALSKAVSSSQQLTWNLNGSKAENYFFTSSGTIDIPNGATSFSVDIIGIQNSIYDKNKVFNLGVLGSADSFGNKISLVIEIVDDDPEPQVVVKTAPDSAYSGNQLRLAVAIDRPSSESISTEWKITENSLSMNQGGYSVTSGTVNFEPYATSATIDFPVNISAGTLSEDVALAVELLNPVGMAAFNAPPILNGIIMNPVLPIKVTINQASGQSDPSEALPVVFNTFFNRPIDPSTFMVDDIQQSGTASGLVWNIVDSGDHQNFELRLIGLSANGTVIPTITGNKILSDLGKDNLASASQDNSVTINLQPQAPIFTSITPAITNSVTQPAILGLLNDTVSTTIEFFADNNCTGVNSIGSGDKAAFETTGIAISAPSNSTIAIYAQAIFGSGRSACTYLTSFTHDNIAPTSAGISINGGAIYATTTEGTLSLTATSANSFYVTNTPGCISGGSYNPFASLPQNLLWVLSANQTNNVYAKFKDLAGNESSCVNASIIVDTIAPDTPTYSSTDPVSPGNNLTPKILGGAASLDTNTVFIYTDVNCAFSSGSGTRNVFTGPGITLNTLPSNQVSKLYGMTRDNAGNFSGCTYLTDYYARGYWSYISGGTIPNSTGVFGTQGVAAPGSVPPGLYHNQAVADGSGNFWMFGGAQSYNNVDYWNTLWKWDGGNWTWVTGGTTIREAANYGTINVPALTNRIGARVGHLMWRDNTNNLYVFGGRGYVTSGSGLLNDVWQYSITTGTWTWIKGSNTVDVSTIVAGTRGTANNANVPNGRRMGCGATDSNGHFWFYGGRGWDTGGSKYWRDLWKFDGSDWTWMAGDMVPDAIGVYGAKGVANTSNQPGAKIECAAWFDNSDNFWLFGGEGVTSATFVESSNDLWKYDKVADMWTWVSGGTIGYPTDLGNYDLSKKGIPSASYTPSPRKYASYWRDNSGNFWLYGGAPENTTATPPRFNDLWKFNPSTLEWTLVDGDPSVTDLSIIYGTINVPVLSNTPGGRFNSGVGLVHPISGAFYMFGGNTSNKNTGDGRRNDFWRFGF